MIWVRGEVVPDDALSVSVLDRTFEHGLGLFETLRTWGGRPTLLGRHLERLGRSAFILGLETGRGALPDAGDVAALISSEGIEGDCSLRITLSGGFDDGRPGTLWMRTRPLPPPIPGPGAKICASWSVAEGDLLPGFKTLNYWSKRIAFERARAEGFDETLGRDASGAVLEGSRSNLFLVAGGRLVTPALGPDDSPGSPLLPGIMRGVVIERARALGLEVEAAARVTADAIGRADECFLTNAGRGIMPVAWFGPIEDRGRGPDRSFDSPGPITRLLMDDLDAWLRSEDAR